MADEIQKAAMDPITALAMILMATNELMSLVGQGLEIARRIALGTHYSEADVNALLQRKQAAIDAWHAAAPADKPEAKP